MAAPLVSIITPSYNQGHFLEQTIQSVISQDYPNLEYIVMDGGSTDGSVEIIQRYADQIAYWVSKKDNGQGEAINAGFARATGKYIAWLNSDDVFLPGCIKKAVAVLEANPQAGMAFGQVEVINQQGKSISMFPPVSYRFEDMLSYQVMIPQQAAFFRRSSLDQVGHLNTDLHFALDHDLFLRLGERFQILAIPDVMAQYRLSDINKGSISRSKWAAEFIQILDLFFLHHTGKYDSFRSMAYAGAYYHGACSLLDDGLYTQARQWYLQSTKLQPKRLATLRWWIGFVRTWLGHAGNHLYINTKILLAKTGLRANRYDWWIALALAKNKEKVE
jgi:glycosyltransferase involved in cell wall biosynthesis